MIRFWIAQSPSEAVLVGLALPENSHDIKGIITPADIDLLSRLGLWSELRVAAVRGRRKEEFNRSRRVFRTIWRDFEAEVGRRPTDWSLSHSGNAVAVALRSSSVSRGLGVDLEARHRDISKRAIARFVRSAERRLGLTPIEVWSAKEAVFKAAFGGAEAARRRTVSEVSIQTWDPVRRQGHARLGSKRFRFALYEINTGFAEPSVFVMALAVSATKRDKLIAWV